VATTDKERKLHPLCLGVSNSERQEDFQILFNDLKESVFSIYSHSLQPSALVCHAAKSIQNAFTEVFVTAPIVRMCWAHAKRNMQTRVEQTSDKKIQKCILEDIDALQSATSPEPFNAASQLFIKKWKKQTSFIEYFKIVY
jgi:transposase-like protein